MRQAIGRPYGLPAYAREVPQSQHRRRLPVLGWVQFTQVQSGGGGTARRGRRRGAGRAYDVAYDGAGVAVVVVIRGPLVRGCDQGRQAVLTAGCGTGSCV